VCVELKYAIGITDISGFTEFVFLFCNRFDSHLSEAVFNRISLQWLMCDGLTDVDECEVRNGGCQQLCSNSAGSYACTCETGFVLGPDSKSCNGTSSPPSLASLVRPPEATLLCSAAVLFMAAHANA